MEENHGGFDKLFESPIKKISTDKIETVIAECLSNLVGEKLETKIDHIDYNPGGKDHDTKSSASIQITVYKPSEGFFSDAFKS